MKTCQSACPGQDRVTRHGNRVAWSLCMVPGFLMESVGYCHSVSDYLSDDCLHDVCFCLKYYLRNGK